MEDKKYLEDSLQLVKGLQEHAQVKTSNREIIITKVENGYTISMLYNEFYVATNKQMVLKIIENLLNKE